VSGLKDPEEDRVHPVRAQLKSRGTGPATPLALGLWFRSSRVASLRSADLWRYQSSKVMRPSRMAYLVSSATLRVFNLDMICWRWVSTVLILMCRRFAI
jgi:hypothetical protein